MYIAHKKLPEPIEPQSSIPQTFLDFTDNKKTKETEAFVKNLVPIQEGSGVDKQTAEALKKPVKVRLTRPLLRLKRRDLKQSQKQNMHNAFAVNMRTFSTVKAITACLFFEKCVLISRTIPFKFRFKFRVLECY